MERKEEHKRDDVGELHMRGLHRRVEGSPEKDHDLDLCCYDLIRAHEEPEHTWQ